MWRCVATLAVLAGCTGEEPIREVHPPQCAGAVSGGWDERFVLPGFGGAYTEVGALVRAPDGRVVVGGSFEHVLGAPVRGVAAWDGATWAQVGDGLPWDVHALAYDDAGFLWAAGHMTSDPGGGMLARWDGSTWTTVLEGVPVTTIVRFDGGLAIGGELTSIDGVEAYGLAVWNGATWSPLGLDAGSHVSAATAIPGGLCVAGPIGAAQDGLPFHGGVACWDGASWTALGDDLAGVEAMSPAPDGTWWAVGYFSEYIDDAAVGGVARLEGGVWQIVDGGVQGFGFFPFVDVAALLFDGDDVVVGGDFAAAGPDRVAAHGLARWSPTTGWASVEDAEGLVGVGWSEGDLRGVRALLRDGDGVLVGGRFASLGDTFAPNLARLTPGGDVEPLTGGRPALGGAATPLTMWVGDLVAGGVSAGHVASAPVGVFDGSWRAIPGDPPVVEAHAAFAHADGSLTVASDVVVHWDGARWTRLAVAGQPLLIDADDALYFAVPDHVTGPGASAIERWQHAVTTSLGSVDFFVAALTVHDGELVAAGAVLADDGTASPRMAVRRDGAWRPVDVPVTGGVVAAETSPALGVVVLSSDGQLAAWDGASWTLLGGGATAIAACDTGVYAAFLAGTATPTRTLALHDGTAWRTLDPGRPGVTTRLLATDDELWVGGDTRGDSDIGRWAFSR